MSAIGIKRPPRHDRFAEEADLACGNKVMLTGSIRHEPPHPAIRERLGEARRPGSGLLQFD